MRDTTTNLVCEIARRGVYMVHRLEFCEAEGVALWAVEASPRLHGRCLSSFGDKHRPWKTLCLFSSTQHYFKMSNDAAVRNTECLPSLQAYTCRINSYAVCIFGTCDFFERPWGITVCRTDASKNCLSLWKKSKKCERTRKERFCWRI